MQVLMKCFEKSSHEKENLRHSTHTKKDETHNFLPRALTSSQISRQREILSVPTDQ